MNIALRKVYAMHRNFLSRTISNNNRFQPSNAEYRRVLLLNLMLILLLLIFSIYLVINIFVSKSQEVALIDGVGVIVTLVVFLYFHKTDNIKMTSLALIVVIFAAFIFVLLIRGDEYNFLVWTLVLPSVVYILLGTRTANRIVGLYCVFMLFFMLIRFRTWAPIEFNIQSILNIFGATFVIIMLVGSYEKGRKEAADFMKEKTRQLEFLSITDKLTGLYNRTKLDEIIDMEITRFSRGGNGFTVILADVDHFKSVNDNYGHIFGDTVLIHIAHVLKKSCRQLDAVGRWGGEEFLIVCPETSEDNAVILASRMLQNLLSENHKDVGRITMSIGISAYQQDDTPDTLLKRADDALYLAKSKGRCRIEVL